MSERRGGGGAASAGATGRARGTLAEAGSTANDQATPHLDVLPCTATTATKATTIITIPITISTSSSSSNIRREGRV